MKLKMITIHNLANYGSAFQAMALNQYLRRKGHDCEVIDYNPPYFTKGSLKSRLGRLLNYSAYKRRTSSYRRFAETNMALTAHSYTSLRELEQETWDADAFISGGDQLWNEFYPCGRDDSYKLSFVRAPKFSFGTSLGKDQFSKEGMAHLKQEISSFTGIGVRERSGAKLLKDAGLEQACCVCDPVFLLSEQDYRKYISPVPVKEPYLFVYLVDKSELLNAAVDYISEKLGLKIVLYAGFVPKCRCDIRIKEQSPEETLSYIANADFVLSASFHATAFSSLLHKQFLTLLPGENTNARISDFLDLIGLPERKVSRPEQLTPECLSAIDWEQVDARLLPHVEQSKQYLDRQLQLVDPAEAL